MCTHCQRVPLLDFRNSQESYDMFKLCNEYLLPFFIMYGCTTSYYNVFCLIFDCTWTKKHLQHNITHWKKNENGWINSKNAISHGHRGWPCYINCRIPQGLRSFLSSGLSRTIFFPLHFQKASKQLHANVLMQMQFWMIKWANNNIIWG